jgi:hypothetical protein
MSADLWLIRKNFKSSLALFVVQKGPSKRALFNMFLTLRCEH